MSSAESGGESHRPQRTELVWEGKRTQVERVALPFQVVETINVSRATREETPLLAGLRTNSAAESNPDGDGWRNKLIWGDNKYVLASLLEGFAGKIDLIYIDPPFDTGDDFSFRVRVGDAEVTKEPSLLETRAYYDTWGRGLNSYLQMMYDRLVLMRDLLSEDGSIYVHMDDTVGHYVKALLDEVFGGEHFQSQIIWQRVTGHSDRRGFGINHDMIFHYAKGLAFIWNAQYVPHDKKYVESHYTQIDENGRRFRWDNATAAGSGPPRRFFGEMLEPPPGTHWRWSQERIDQLIDEGRIALTKEGRPQYKRYLDEMPGKVIQSVWTDIAPVNSQAIEDTGFDTQKPEPLLERIIRASSSEGHVVADFFCGSGTTMAVAEKLGRRWIGCDLSRFAIHVARKRLLDIPNCRPFEVLNLGKYERQHWQVHVNGHGANPEAVVARYLDFIVQLYRAERVQGFTHLHGRKAGRMVHLGATDAPVTLAEITDALDECAANNFRGLDVLGWEWEMGLHDLVPVEARKRGVDLRLLTIPREVMDKQAVEAGDVHFYELAYLDAEVRKSGTEVQVGLRNFIIPNLELIPQDVRDKIKRWSDYVDFWAVDWDYQGDTFHNAWQSYRTRKHPALRLESDPHPYEAPGRYQVMVKVIDIFGNDTTKLIPVTVP
jgi:adenine-specific DNA-methyltransferase